MKKQVNSLISWQRALKKMRGKPKKSHKSYGKVQEDSRKKRRNHLVLVFGFFEVINLCLVPSGVWVVVAFTCWVLGNRRGGQTHHVSTPTRTIPYFTSTHLLIVWYRMRGGLVPFPVAFKTRLPTSFHARSCYLAFLNCSWLCSSQFPAPCLPAYLPLQLTGKTMRAHRKKIYIHVIT